MSYSDSFPTQRPSLNLVFNGGSDQLDSRISYSRSSTGTYMSSEKALNSENLLSNSGSISGSGWSSSSVSRSQSGTFLDGSDAFVITETAATAAHYFQAASSNYFSTTSGDSYTVTLFAKSGTVDGLQIVFGSGQFGTNAYANFDLSNASTSPVTGSSATASITALGSGWVKCVVTATATGGGNSATSFALTNNDINAARFPSYTGSTGSNISVWQCNISSTGETILNSTSGSIHREFAPTLKTAAADAPRFEYAADGQSEGLLIEAQATNLQRYGSAFASWSSTKDVVITSNAAISPDGTLAATHVAANSTLGDHYVFDNGATLVSGTDYTASVYVKNAGQRYVQLVGSSGNFGGSKWATFDLVDGSIDANNVTASAESVGNGWWRIQATMAATGSTQGNIFVTLANSATAARSPIFTGDDYSGVMLFGYQLETGSSASSLVDTGSGSSQLSRAADSCSLVSAPLLDNGSGGLTAEYNMFAASDTSYVLHLNKTSGGTNGDGVAITNQYLYVENNYLNISNTSSDTFHKVAASWEAASQKISRDGSAVAEDTSTVVPSGTDKLYIGQRQDGGEPVNGHIRSIAIYSEPLTSTNLTALSQL